MVTKASPKQIVRQGYDVLLLKHNAKRSLEGKWFKLYRASDKAMWTDTLSAKIKVLMRLGVVAGRLCSDCMEMQMKSALNHGATKEEILDTLGVV